MVTLEKELWANSYEVIILNGFYFLADSQEIINNSIKNYVLKLFKKRKNTESRTKKIAEKPIKDIQNSNEKVSENNVPSSSSGNICIFFYLYGIK